MYRIDCVSTHSIYFWQLCRVLNRKSYRIYSRHHLCRTHQCVGPGQAVNWSDHDSIVVRLSPNDHPVCCRCWNAGYSAPTNWNVCECLSSMRKTSGASDLLSAWIETMDFLNCPLNCRRRQSQQYFLVPLVEHWQNKEFLRWSWWWLTLKYWLTVEFPVSSRKIGLCFCGVDAVHPPSRTKFD